MWRLTTAALWLLCSVVPAPAEQFSLELRNDFVHAFHDRATMEVNYTVVGAQIKAHSPQNDGEVHISGTAREVGTNADVGFATVAEIMHASKYEGPGGLLNWIA